MKNLRTFEQFVNESLNEVRGFYGKWYDPEEQACYDLMNPIVQDSIKSLGYGYKGSSPEYKIDWMADEGYRGQELPKMTFALIPLANGNYWGKREVKKMTDRFIKDLQEAQKEYEVTGEYYGKPKGPEIHVTFKKK